MPKGKNSTYRGPQCKIVLKFLGPAPNMNHVKKGPEALIATAISAPPIILPLTLKTIASKAHNITGGAL